MKLDYDVLYGKSEGDILSLSAAIDTPITRQDMNFHLRGIVVLNQLAAIYGDEYVKKTNQELYEEAISVIGA